VQQSINILNETQKEKKEEVNFVCLKVRRTKQAGIETQGIKD
jgi:hypothetical protein